MPRTNDEKTIAEISTIARKIWRSTLADIPAEQLIIIFGEPEIYQVLHAAIEAGLDSQTAFAFLVMPFCDEIGDQTYQIYLEEIRDFVDSDQLIETNIVPSLGSLNREISILKEKLQNSQAAQLKRMNRELNLRGQKGQTRINHKGQLQDRLEMLFGIRDEIGFRQLLRDGKFEAARNWLQYIIDNKDRFFYYHHDWDNWLADRQRELSQA